MFIEFKYAIVEWLSDDAPFGRRLEKSVFISQSVLDAHISMCFKNNLKILSVKFIY